MLDQKCKQENLSFMGASSAEWFAQRALRLSMRLLEYPEWVNKPICQAYRLQPIALHAVIARALWLSSMATVHSCWQWAASYNCRKNPFYASKAPRWAAFTSCARA